MKNKIIQLGNEARKELQKGIEILNNSVKATLGPAGRNVIIENEYELPFSTKDGVTVAKSIKLKDEIQNIGAQIVKEAANQANEVAGDGTTTATVLAHYIYNEGLKFVDKGVNSIEISRGIQKATKQVVKKLQEYSREIKQNNIEQIARISANGDVEIGKLVFMGMDKVGLDGVIVVEEGKTFESSLDVVEGMQFERGYLSPYFITNNSSMQAELDDPYILITTDRLSQAKPLIKILEKIIAARKPLLIIAEDVESEALATFIVNKTRGAISVCAVKAPDFGDNRKQILEDIACLTGGQVVSKDKGNNFEEITLEMLGRARTVTVDNKKTTIIDGQGTKEAIETRVAEIKVLSEKAKSKYEEEKFQNRLAKLSGGIAIINIGAQTEFEMKEKKARVEDALNATRAAIEEGIIPGGGITFMHIFEELSKSKENSKIKGEEKIGVDILLKSLRSPFMTILENAGENGDAIWQKILVKKSKSHGFDVQNRTYCDFYDVGIIDPTKVARVALEKAASISGLLLTTESIIANESEKEPVQQEQNYMM